MTTTMKMERLILSGVLRRTEEEAGPPAVWSFMDLQISTE